LKILEELNKPITLILRSGVFRRVSKDEAP
jgi:hypothetical protein